MDSRLTGTKVKFDHQIVSIALVNSPESVAFEDSDVLGHLRALEPSDDERGVLADTTELFRLPFLRDPDEDELPAGEEALQPARLRSPTLAGRHEPVPGTVTDHNRLMALTLDALLDDFAIRSFRDISDGDYVTARMAYKASLAPQFLWSSQQAIEKQLKCILLLNRIPAAHVKHDLAAGLSAVRTSGRLQMDLAEGTREFIARLDQLGRFRYFEVPNIFFSEDIIRLDRAVWELRRYCTPVHSGCLPKLRDGFTVPRVWIAGGHLENIISDVKNPARGALLWQNSCFGRKARRLVRLGRYAFKAANAPLWLNPDILDEVLKYVYVPKDVQNAYRKHAVGRKKQKIHAGTA